MIDIIAEARQQAGWFAVHGYHPGRAPAAVSAAILLAPPRRRPFDWVGLARLVVAAQAIIVVSVFIALELVMRAWALDRYHAWLPEALLDAALAAAAIVMLIAARLVMWGSRWPGVRLGIALAMIAALIDGSTILPPYGGALIVGCSAVLLMSVARPDDVAA